MTEHRRQREGAGEEPGTEIRTGLLAFLERLGRGPAEARERS
uniref:Uncharacterized protein n=1 Tax=Streptomyces sp. NBC_01401 TaxID=2903854 RepID=A0AAU3GX37_9ACTN